MFHISKILDYHLRADLNKFSEVLYSIGEEVKSMNAGADKLDFNYSFSSSSRKENFFHFIF